MAQAYELEFTELSDSGRGTIVFYSNPNAEGWGELEGKITTLLARQILDWKFDIREMRFCDSHGLGMWLKLSTTIRNARGRALFVVRDPSRVLDLFRLTKLDLVLDVMEERVDGVDT